MQYCSITELAPLLDEDEDVVLECLFHRAGLKYGVMEDTRDRSQFGSWHSQIGSYCSGELKIEPQQASRRTVREYRRYTARYRIIVHEHLLWIRAIRNNSCIRITHKIL